MNQSLWRQLVEQMDSLPARLGGHIFLTFTALAVGTVISIPVGVWASRRPRFEQIALTLASIVQTVPGLALLALMVFVWQTIGWAPALIALILYSVLPILRNTITGLENVDAAVLEAAAGVGMSPWQTLRYVQLPLAAPVIVAGIRTAAVWVVGAATIAQPVGATSLGNYIFVGLQTMNFVSLLFGCVLSAVLALSVDGLLHSLQRASDRRSRSRAGWTLAGIVLLGCSPLLLNVAGRLAPISITASEPSVPSPAPNRSISNPIVIGSKAFTEQYIWAEVFRRRLSAAGMPVEVRDGMGSATVFQALQAGQIDCYVDYTGTIWTNYLKRAEIVPPVDMLIEVASYLKRDRSIYCLGALGFSNDYAFAVSRETAAKHDLSSLHDLARVAPQLVSGTDLEFFARPEWRAVRNRYGVRFQRKVTMDPTLMYGALVSGQLDVVVAFNTDARLDRYDLVTLADPERTLPPYDAVLLVSPRLAHNPSAMQALRPLIQSVNSTTMRRANGIVDIDQQTIGQAADFLLGNMESTANGATFNPQTANR